MLIPEKAILEQLAIHQRTLRRWVADGFFPPGVRVGRRQLFWRSTDLNAWEKKLPIQDTTTNPAGKHERVDA